MLPTLAPGDRLVLSYRREPAPGRVAVVRLPGPVVAVKRLSRREPDGRWWVTSDNSVEGVDSRSVGAVSSDDVLAVALGRVWPRPRRL